MSYETVIWEQSGAVGRLTLNHIQELQPARVLVTNRSLERAKATAAAPGSSAPAAPPPSTTATPTKPLPPPLPAEVGGTRH